MNVSENPERFKSIAFIVESGRRIALNEYFWRGISLLSFLHPLYIVYTCNHSALALIFGQPSKRLLAAFRTEKAGNQFGSYVKLVHHQLGTGFSQLLLRLSRMPKN